MSCSLIIDHCFGLNIKRLFVLRYQPWLTVYNWLVAYAYGYTVLQPLPMIVPYLTIILISMPAHFGNGCSFLIAYCACYKTYVVWTSVRIL